MKKFKKILLIIFLFLLFILVGGMIALRIAFPPAKVKALLIAKMAEALHRQVEIEGISVGLGGLKVKGFKISEQPTFEKGIFVQAEEFIIKPKLLPLLKKQVSISEIRLVSPKINIVRRTDGSFNFSDLMVKKVVRAEKEEKEEKVEKRVPEKINPMVFSFLISKVSISNGNVKFVDRTPQKLSADLKNINLSVYGISLVSPFFVETSFAVAKEKLEFPLAFKATVNIKEEAIKVKEAAASLGGAGIKATGSVDKFMKPEKLSFAVNIKGEGFTLEKLSRIVPFRGNLLMAGEPDINVDVSGNLKRIGMKGNIGLRKVDVLFKNIFHKPSGVDAEMAANIVLEDSKVLNVTLLSVALSGMKASAAGKVVGLKDERAVNLKVAIEKFDMKSLQELVPPAKDYGVSGMVGADVEISGKPESLTISGKIGVENVGAIQKEMAVKLDRSSLKYSGNIVDFKKPVVNFDLDMGAIEVKIPEKPGEVKPGAKKENPGAKKENPAPQVLPEKGPPKLAIPPDATVSGNIRLKKLSVQNYQISDCAAKLDLAKSILNLNLSSLTAYDGSLKGNLFLDLREPSLENVKFNLDGEIKNINMHKVIQSVGRETKAEFYAIASGTMKISGSGKDFSKLNGSGLLQIKDVKIRGIKILDRIASSANIPELKETSFKSATGKLDIKSGKVYLRDVKTEAGDKLDAYCSGNVDLTRKTQDIKGDIKFAKKYSGGDLAKYAGDAQGRVTVPFKIDGTFGDPKVNLDWGKLTKKAAEKAAEDILKKEIEKGLKKLFKK